jgi:hypothetical protein
MMSGRYILAGFFVVSVVLALPLVVRLWRSDEVPLLKVLTTFVLFIPVLGPLMYFMAYRAPPSMHSDLMDQVPRRTDVLDRWRDRLEAGGRLPKRRRPVDDDQPA